MHFFAKSSDSDDNGKIFEFRPILLILFKKYDPIYGHMGT